MPKGSRLAPYLAVAVLGACSPPEGVPPQADSNFSILNSRSWSWCETGGRGRICWAVYDTAPDLWAVDLDTTPGSPGAIVSYTNRSGLRLGFPGYGGPSDMGLPASCGIATSARTVSAFFSKVSLRAAASRIQLMGYAVSHQYAGLIRGSRLRTRSAA